MYNTDKQYDKSTLQSICKHFARSVQSLKSDAKLLQNQFLGGAEKHPYLCIAIQLKHRVPAAPTNTELLLRKSCIAIQLKHHVPAAPTNIELLLRNSCIVKQKTTINNKQLTKTIKL